jgi:ketosteroid isomerase-like protein
MSAEMSKELIARAFSEHEFDTIYPYLADSVVWHVVGDDPLVGKEEVVNACEESAEYLDGVTAKFTRFNVLSGEDFVVIDSEADYEDEDDASTVASSDIYKFEDGKLIEITSYNVEIGEEDEDVHAQ